MELKKALRLGDTSKLALVGAGGKTSALFLIARQYPGRVIITTTTHLSVDETQWGDVHFIPPSIEDLHTFLKKTTHRVITLTGPFEGERATSLAADILSWVDWYCSRHCLPVLIEADGSKRRPIKAPAAYEPVIPGFVEQVVVMVGVSALGKSLDSKWVHRPEIFSALSGLEPGEPITTKSIVDVLINPQGGLKNIPLKARRTVFFNQVDTPNLLEVVAGMALPLLSDYSAVISGALKIGKFSRSEGCVPSASGSIQNSGVVHAVYEHIAGIVLAAGSGQRYGIPKQLLEWQGKPLVWHSVRKGLEAGLRPVIVVSGAYPSQIESALYDLPVKIVHNPDWNQGQGTSVRAGVMALPFQVGGAVFLLADQPLIPVQLIQSLVEKHRQTLSPITVPWAKGRRANPVLFDKTLFGDLENLKGDAGGRQLFSKCDITRVPWDDSHVFHDVDTPDDYQQLLEMDA